MSRASWARVCDSERTCRQPADRDTSHTQVFSAYEADVHSDVKFPVRQLSSFFVHQTLIATASLYLVSEKNCGRGAVEDA